MICLNWLFSIKFTYISIQCEKKIESIANEAVNAIECVFMLYIIYNPAMIQSNLDLSIQYRNEME